MLNGDHACVSVVLGEGENLLGYEYQGGMPWRSRPWTQELPTDAQV